MRELSLHIMDIMENSLVAEASLIRLSIVEHSKDKLITIRITDNGRGIPQEQLQKVLDPFFTTRTTRRIGLGLSLFREASKRCGGEFSIKSREGEGTEIWATFQSDHIDRPPMGNMAGSLGSLIAGNPDVDFVYTHEIDGRVFELDARLVKKELDGVPINHPEVYRYITETITEEVAKLHKA